MNVKAGRSKKEERAETTRAALLAAARELFAADGYSGVAMEQVVARAGVTRGALYHHFSDKRDLFRAVYEDVEGEVTEQVAKRALEAGTDAWTVSRAGWRAFLDVCRDPALSRIAFVDAPAVLGLREWHEIADRYGGALIRANLDALMEAGEIEPAPVESLARILVGALIEGAFAIAEADDPDETQEQIAAAIDRVMSGMRRPR